MFFLFLLIYALGQHIKAAPLVTPPWPNEFQLRDASTCDCSNAPHQRSLFDIIWSCLVTLFACTWISVHPNIPSISDSSFTVARRRVRIMIYALIVPEGVMYWAMRQWLGSRKLAHRYAEDGWTAVHGHFLQMGGFVIDEPGKPSYTLSPEYLETLLIRHEISLPSITAAEIQDKSKGDFLAKGVVALQVLWFVTQCIARGVQGLTVTELEVVTLAFAVFNGVTYFLWWHKPLDVRCPFHLRLNGLGPLKISPEATLAKKTDSTIWQFFLDVLNDILDVLFFNISDDIRRRGAAWALRKRLKLLLRPFVNARETLHQMSESDDSTAIKPNATRVPTFYAMKMDVTQEYFMDCTMSFCAMIFGSIHCIAWVFPFPTHTERTMWRFSSLVIICVPAALLFVSLLRLSLLRRWLPRLSLPRLHHIFPCSTSILCYIATFILIHLFDGAQVVLIANIIGLILYIPSRLLIVILAALSLRSAGDEAFEAVDWTRFVPHF